MLELELIASLSGLTGAVLSLRNYIGFQYAYGLPFVQAFLKGTTGAATGLFGVLLVRSAITGSLTLKPGASAFVVAVIFGYAQYLFTRLVDQQANTVLKSAGSRSDPSNTPSVPPGGDAPALLTTSPAPRPQVSGVSSNHGEAAGGEYVTLTGSGFTAATAVNFGSNDTKYFTVNSDTQITVKTPPGNGTVTITVTTPVGTSLGSAAAQFTYTSTSAEGKASQPAAPGSGFNQALRNVPRADLNRALRHCPSCQTPGTAAVINGARAVRVRTHCAAMTVVDSTLNCLSWRQPGRVMAQRMAWTSGLPGGRGRLRSPADGAGAVSG